MNSALTPREIQTRIRSGEALDEVAKDAGVPADQIEVYAAPVIAERDHVAGTALTCPVRRTGESSSARPLRAVVAERLQQRTIDVDSVQWDAWRDPDRRWTVTASYQSGTAAHSAEFTFDLRGRFSVARNDEARWLIGETTPAHGPQPGRKRKDPDTEPTVDLNDELALVRAIQGDEAPETPSSEYSPVQPSVGQAPDEKADENQTDEQHAGEQYAEGAENDPSDYTEVELAEVDGVYDIVPAPNDMDVLYDMLSSFNEDSVNIYSGLTRPVVDEDPVTQPTDVSDEVEQARDEEWDAAEPLSPEPLSLEPESPEPQAPESQTPESETPEPETTEPETTEQRPAAHDPVDEPQQDSLLEPESEPTLIRTREQVEQASKPKSRARKRAAVPSWDEIMFGSPHQRDTKKD